MDIEEQLVNAVKSATTSEVPGDKRKLTCAKAFELAKKFDVKIIKIGNICNQHKIKISSCQLGCFK